MKQLVFQRSTALTTLLFLLAAGCAANMATQPDTARTGGVSGLVAHIDPTTGEFLPEPPAAGVTPPQRADAAKAPAPQFDVVPSPTPGGGLMIDLKNHFRTPLVATMDADGKVTVKHEPMSPTGAENK